MVMVKGGARCWLLPKWGVAKMSQPRSLPSSCRSHSTYTLKKQHNPAKLPSSLCHDHGNAHPPGLCLEDPPHPHIADHSCWSQNSLTSWPLTVVALISGLEASYQLPNSSTERAPHLWCCIMLDLLWLNKGSYKPWNPHENTPGSNILLQLPTVVPLGSIQWVGFLFFSFSPLGQKCVSGRQILPRQGCSPTPPFTHSLPKDIKAVCIRLRVVKIEVWQSLQSHWISKESPFDYLSFSIYPFCKWVDSHTWVSFNHSAALYIWLLWIIESLQSNIDCLLVLSLCVHWKV